jgi:hypothetical protein
MSVCRSKRRSELMDRWTPPNSAGYAVNHDPRGFFDMPSTSAIKPEYVGR